MTTIVGWNPPYTIPQKFLISRHSIRAMFHVCFLLKGGDMASWALRNYAFSYSFHR